MFLFRILILGAVLATSTSWAYAENKSKSLNTDRITGSSADSSFDSPSSPAVKNSPDYIELKEKFNRMERRVKKLEGRSLGTPGQGITDPTATQDGMSSPPSNLGSGGPRVSGSSADSAFSTVTGLSRTFNPAISVNGLFEGTYRSQGNNDPNAEVKTGLNIREIELQFSANVDKWLRANIRFTFEEDEFELEEAFVDLLLLDRLALRAGQFYANFGKHNLLHTHQFPFIDRPLVNEEIFGEEALLELGIGLSYMVPVPWYSEFMFQFLEGNNENLFNAPLNDDFAYLIHTKNLWDLDEDTTLELGGSFITGRNMTGANAGMGSSMTKAFGGNMTVKWKPARRQRYQTLVWQTEYIGSWQEVGPGLPKNDQGGIYSYLQYQFLERWWVQGRYDYFGLHRPAGVNEKHQVAALIGYVPSEFSAVRLQYSFLDDMQDDHRLVLQLNFSLGSHPAHLY